MDGIGSMAILLGQLRCGRQGRRRSLLFFLPFLVLLLSTSRGECQWLEKMACLSSLPFFRMVVVRGLWQYAA